MIEEFVAAAEWPEPVQVECVDTGTETPTGGRVALAGDRFCDGTFCLTYADGVADIDLAALTGFHGEQGVMATMTVVRPYSQWGIAVIDQSERIEGFREKPRLDYWINGGFFCLEPAFLDYVSPSSVLEREPLEHAAAAGPARRVPTRRLLGLHGHLQGRDRPQRPVVRGRAALADLGGRLRRSARLMA